MPAVKAASLGNFEFLNSHHPHPLVATNASSTTTMPSTTINDNPAIGGEDGDSLSITSGTSSTDQQKQQPIKEKQWLETALDMAPRQRQPPPPPLSSASSSVLANQQHNQQQKKKLLSSHSMHSPGRSNGAQMHHHHNHQHYHHHHHGSMMAMFGSDKLPFPLPANTPLQITVTQPAGGAAAGNQTAHQTVSLYLICNTTEEYPLLFEEISGTLTDFICSSYSALSRRLLPSSGSAAELKRRPSTSFPQQTTTTIRSTPYVI